MKKSTVVILAGGLGNQIFQLASALSYPPSREIRLAYGLTECDMNSVGAPAIADFQLNMLGVEIIKFEKKWFSSKIINLILRLKSGRYGKSFMSDKNPIHLTLALILKLTVAFSSLSDKELFPIHGKRLNFLKSRLQVGYFQQEPRDQGIIEVLRSQLKLKSDSKWLAHLKELSIVERPLIIHIRLGDYKSQKNFGNLSSDYFKSGMHLLSERLSFGKIWLFSNEASHALKYFNEEERKNIRVISSEFQTASAELEAMRLGYGYVISNSTFSWWGARLSYNLGAPVCVPHPWFAGLSSFAGIYVKEWHKIETKL